MSIKNWRSDDKPREKLIEKGASALSDSELIAILIGSGTKEVSAIELAKKLLDGVNGNLELMGRMSMEEMMMLKGIGVAKAVTLMAAMELGRRRSMYEAEVVKLDSPEEAAKYLVPKLSDLSHEEFWMLCLANNNKLIASVKIGRGSDTASVVGLREIARTALLKKAVKVILSHNHPSGNIMPSDEDKRITERIKKAFEFLDIQLIDHIIVGGNNYFSFANENLL